MFIFLNENQIKIDYSLARQQNNNQKQLKLIKNVKFVVGFSYLKLFVENKSNIKYFVEGKRFC